MKNLTSIKDKSLNGLSSFRIENLASLKGGVLATDGGGGGTTSSGTTSGAGTCDGQYGTVAWDADYTSSSGNKNYINLRWVCKN